MQLQELNFGSASDVLDPLVKSLIYEVRVENQISPLALYYYDNQWIVDFSTPERELRISWTSFMEILRFFSTAIADETTAMLKECRDENAQSQ